MFLPMWYRIELNKDNSVSTCVEVEGSRTDEGKSVHFIEASSRQEAISTLLERYNSHKNRNNAKTAKLRASRIAANLCDNCGKNEPIKFQRKCPICREIENRRKANRRAGIFTFKRSTTDQEKAATQLRKQAADKRRRYTKADGKLTTRRVAYASCLQAFDSMTTNAYRTWLVEQLKIAQDKELASAEKRSAAFNAKQARKYTTAAE